MTGPSSQVRLPLFGRNAAAERLVQERTWSLEQQVEVLETRVRDLERILRSMGEGVLAVDRAGIVVYANPAVVDLLGLDPDACHGSHMFVAVPQRDACDLIEDVMRGAGPWLTRELVVEHPEGERVLVLGCRPLRKAGAEDDEPEGAIVVVRDVTDLRRLERARQDFFGNVSHELKTPVTAIRGAIETIVDDEGMDDAVRARFLDGAYRHSIRLSALVTDLLSLARLEGGPRMLQREEIDLVSVVGEVLAAAKEVAAAKGVVLELCTELDDAASALAIDGDEEAIQQAAANLIDNAIAHSDEGGVVRVTIQRSGEAAELLVRDDGTGIPEEALERIFERFYRVDAARSRARGGTGIGLSIVKHVAQAHLGSVSVESALGEGSTFTLRLPVSQPRQRGTRGG